jgi:hypothetical protein
VRGQVANGFGAAERVADEHHVVQVQVSGHGGDVGGESVQVVAPAGHVGPPVSTAVKGDAAQPGFEERRDLVVPHGLVDPEPVHQEEGLSIRVSPVGEVKLSPVDSGGKWHDVVSFASGECCAARIGTAAPDV